MSKTIQFSIPTPCHENWDAMNPVEKGRFCGSCQKQVVDFSTMSDREIAQLFKKTSTGSVCGRFTENQLGRDIGIPQKRIPWVKYFLQFALPAFLVSIKTSAQTLRKGRQAAVVADTIKPMLPQSKQGICNPYGSLLIDTNRDTDLLSKTVLGNLAVYEKTVIDTAVVKGRVLDEKGDPLAFATVMVKGLAFGVMANDKGEFSIKCGNHAGLYTLSASSVGYTDSEIRVNTGLYTGDTLVIRMEPRVSMYTTGVIVACRKPAKDQKNVPLMEKAPKETSSKFFKVFPNPARSAGTIYIKWVKMKEGTYVFALLNQSGQMVFVKEMALEKPMRMDMLELPSLPSGIYFLNLTGKQDGKIATQKIIIQ